jgi:hypothetical protein
MIKSSGSQHISRFAVLAFWAVTFAITLWPMARADFPLGADMLNHVSRLHVLHTLPADSDLQKFYLADWGILPNLALDIIALPLLDYLTPYQAGKAFIGLSIILLFFGVSALRRQLFGKVGLLPLCVALIAYNAPLAFGFANFYFGLGLALLMVVGWRASEVWPWWARAVIGSIFAITLFFTHLIVVALYAFILFSLRGTEILRHKRLNFDQDAPLIIQFIVPAILWLNVKAAAHGTETIFGSAYNRFEALITPVLYFNEFDIAVGLAVIGLIFFLLFTKRLRVAPAFQLTIVALILVSLLMPVRLMGVWLTHIRLPVMVALLLIATIEINIDDRRFRILLAATLVLFTLLRLDKVDRYISGCDDRRQQFFEVIAPLPKGARILPVIEQSSITGDCLFSDYWHMSSMAVIEKSAFYPMMFVHMQPLAIRTELSHLVQKIAEPAPVVLLSGNTDTYGEADWNAVIAANWRKEFDYLVWLHPGTNISKTPEDITEVSRADFVRLFRIDTNSVQ